MFCLHSGDNGYKKTTKDTLSTAIFGIFKNPAVGWHYPLASRVLKAILHVWNGRNLKTFSGTEIVLVLVATVYTTPVGYVTTENAVIHAGNAIEEADHFPPAVCYATKVICRAIEHAVIHLVDGLVFATDSAIDIIGCAAVRKNQALQAFFDADINIVQVAGQDDAFIGFIKACQELAATILVVIIVRVVFSLLFIFFIIIAIKTAPRRWRARLEKHHRH